jgi:hypothetical protein
MAEIPWASLFILTKATFIIVAIRHLRWICSLFTQWAKLNFAVLPIGDNFTMGYEDAVRAARMIDCKNIIGVHYDTFGFIKIDHEKAKKAFNDDEENCSC